jgi:hypothetical protein
MVDLVFLLGVFGKTVLCCGVFCGQIVVKCVANVDICRALLRDEK